MTVLSRILRLLAILVVIGGAGALLVSGFDIASVETDQMRDLARAMAMAIMPLIVVQLIMALRIAVLLSAPRKFFAKALRVGLLSQGTDLILPWRLSDVVKVTYLHLAGPLPAERALSVVVSERFSDLVAVCVLGTIVLIGGAVGLSIWTIGSVAVVGLLGFVSLWLFKPFWDRVIRILPGQWLPDFASRLLNDFVAQLTSGAFILALGIGLCAWSVTVLATDVFLGFALPTFGHPPPSLIFSAGLLIAVTLGNIVAVLPASLGTFEAVAVIVLQGVGLAFESALLIAVALHILFLLPGIVGGAVVAFTDRHLYRQVLARARRRAEDETGS